jgi:hypothetical protein
MFPQGGDSQLLRFEGGIFKLIVKLLPRNFVLASRPKHTLVL